MTIWKKKEEKLSDDAPGALGKCENNNAWVSDWMSHSSSTYQGMSNLLPDLLSGLSAVCGWIEFQPNDGPVQSHDNLDGYTRLTLHCNC